MRHEQKKKGKYLCFQYIDCTCGSSVIGTDCKEVIEKWKEHIGVTGGDSSWKMEKVESLTGA